MAAAAAAARAPRASAADADADADADTERAALEVACLAASSGGPRAPSLSPEVWRLLADSHAHPQLADYSPETAAQPEAPSASPPSSAAAAAAAAREAAARQTLLRARAGRIGCMSVGAAVDWARVEALAELDARESRPCARRIVPAFGIHPWWAHLHGAREAGGRGDGEGGDGRGGEAASGQRLGADGEEEEEEEEEETMWSLLEAPDEAGLEAALQAVARAAAEGRLGLYGEGAGGDAGQGEEEGEEEGRGARRREGATATAAAGGPAPSPPHGRPFPHVAPIPRGEWEPRLRALLAKHPSAIVGEIGLDRSAVLPAGSSSRGGRGVGAGGDEGAGAPPPPASAARARCRPSHQRALLRAQLSVAAAMGRPASVHCVRAHGALYDELRARALASAAAAAAAGDVRAGARRGRGAERGGRPAAEPAAAHPAPAPAPAPRVADGLSPAHPPPAPVPPPPAARTPRGLPPAVMMHSFGGPPAEARRLGALERLSGGARCRVYFSFSAAVNGRPPREAGAGSGVSGAAEKDGREEGRGVGGGGGGEEDQAAAPAAAATSSRDDARAGPAPAAPSPAARAAALKLALRIRAVPADRLLLESDQVAPGRMDAALEASLRLVAAARGWGAEETARRCRDNFEAFCVVAG